MPTHADGYLVPFTQAEIDAMLIEDAGVRDGSHPIETRELDQSTMIRPWLVRWESRYDFLELCLGDSKLWDDSGTTRISRLLPDATYGRHPFYTQMIATRINEIRGHAIQGLDANKMPRYKMARVTVFYEHAPFFLRSDAGLTNETQRYVRRGPTASETEAFTLPGGAFKYTRSGGGGASGTPVPFNVSITRPVERFTLYHEMLPYECYTTAGAMFKRLYEGDGDGVPYSGTVNKEPLVIDASFTYPAGTVLYEKVEPELVRSPLAGTGATGFRWRLGHHLAFTPRGWLDLFHFDPVTPSDSGWYRPTVNGTYYATSAMPDNTGLFNVRDHMNLFDPNY